MFFLGFHWCIFILFLSLSVFLLFKRTRRLRKKRGCHQWVPLRRGVVSRMGRRSAQVSIYSLYLLR